MKFYKISDIFRLELISELAFWRFLKLKVSF